MIVARPISESSASTMDKHDLGHPGVTVNHFHLTTTTSLDSVQCWMRRCSSSPEYVNWIGRGHKQPTTLLPVGRMSVLKIKNHLRVFMVVVVMRCGGVNSHVRATHFYGFCMSFAPSSLNNIRMKEYLQVWTLLCLFYCHCYFWFMWHCKEKNLERMKWKG